MKKSKDFLDQMGFKSFESESLPTSEKLFPDGAQYRIEIPSVEGVNALKETIAEIKKYDFKVHRISQGSGIMLLTDEEIKEMCHLANQEGMELSLFIGPRGTWDISAQPFTDSGKSIGLRHEGLNQILYGMEDLKRAANLGLRSALFADEGLIKIADELKKRGELPEDFVIKASVQLGAANPVSVEIIENLGANTYNVPTALTLNKLASIRHSIDIPIDIYIEVPDNFGGFLRYYEIPEIIRVLSPVYLKFGLRNHPDVYPSGQHLEDLNKKLTKERVRRAYLGQQMVDRYYPDAVTSELHVSDLGIPEI